MTTSTNKIKGESVKGGAAKVASATLAGVLAVGMVPAVALADVADDVEAEGSEQIQPMLSDAAKNFNEGKVTTAAVAAWDGIDTTVGVTLNDGKATVTPDSSDIAITVDLSQITVTLGDSSTITNPAWTNGTAGGSTFRVAYYKGTTAAGTELAAINGLGDYCVAIKATGGAYDGAQIVMPVKVNGISVEGAAVAIADAEGTAIATPVYSGKELEVVPTVTTSGGTELTEGLDYTMKIVAGGTSADSAAVTPKDAGTYGVVITGTGKYTGVNTSTTFTISAFDLEGLSATNFKTAPVIGSNSMPTAANILSITDAAASPNTLIPTSSDISIALATNQVWANNGMYTFNVTPAAGQTNVVDSDPDTPATCSIAKVGAEAVYKYDGGALPTDITIDTTDPKSATFDSAKLEVYLADGTTELHATAAAPATADYELTYSQDGGSFAPLTGDYAADWLTKAKSGDIAAGDYVVRVAILNASTNTAKYAVGGYKDINIKVIKGQIDATAEATINYNGVAFTSLTLPYSPNGYKFKDTGAVFTAKAKLSNGSAATGLTVEATDSNGKKVNGDTITNVGTYTLKIKSSTYEITGTDTATVVIEPMNLKDLTLGANGSTIKKVNGNIYVDTNAGDVADTVLHNAILTSYIESENPTVYKDLATDFSDVDAKLSVTLQKYVDGLWVAEPSSKIAQHENGVAYRLRIAPTDSSLAANATFATDEGTFINIPTSNGNWAFNDVSPDAWYFNSVAIATAGQSAPATVIDKFMSGYAGTKLFGPMDNMTRGQVACILYNMALSSPASLNPDAMGTTGSELADGYVSFDDVDSRAYYAKPIAWAKQVGVVSGFAGTNDFGPDQTVTREQFVCMLANYAKAIQSTTLDGITDEAMNKLPDAGAVSDWAKDGVAWAVQNEIIGNGGFINPSATLPRAEAAAMGVNFLQKNNA